MIEWGEDTTDETPCENCHKAQNLHIPVNYGEGLLSGGTGELTVLLCPTSTYKPVFTPKPRQRKR